MNDFRKMADRRLNGLCFQPLMENTLRAVRQQEEAHASRRMRPALAFALVLLAVLLAATALATGLRWSARMNAVNAAHIALKETYGLEADVLSLFEQQAEQTEMGWQFIYRIVRNDLADKAGSYTVAVAKDGTTQTHWSLEDANESERWNAKQLESWKQKQDEAFRAIEDAAYTPSLADEVEVVEETKAQPVSSADQALQDTYGLSPETLALFTSSATQDENGCWLVIYQPADQPLWGVDVTQWQECLQKMGQYQVGIGQDMRTVHSCIWSLDGVDDGEYYADSYGQAQAFSQNELKYLLETIQRRAEIISRYASQNEQGWLVAVNDEPISVEDNAALDGILLEAGFTGGLNHVLPQQDDLTMEQAKEIFYQAVYQKYGTSREVFDSSIYAYADLTQEADGRQWYFWLQSAQELCSWSIQINAETGEIINLVYDTIAAGNG